ncbi:MAG: alpha/beta fold hydrolase [Acidobacteria bacterium]|nr:alpha/beta fold hydrolase [Acidobacteriota bacterium]MBV9478547.1 alpha/beta fold hydrolase [Acidobacteriota bacterium]
MAPVDVFHEIRGDGEPLFLLNGIMMTTASWAQETRRLAKSYRCVLHDFRGQLRTPVPGPYALRDHVDDLAALFDRLGIDRAHLAGTSYGGEVAMLFALAHPERVRTLTVIASVSHSEAPLRASVTRWRDTALHAPDALYDLTLPDNFSPDFVTPVLAQQGRDRLSTYPPEFFRAFADLCDAFLTLDITDELHAIRCPTLVIAAERDALKPVHYSEIIASRIPNARLAIVPNAGHAVVIERPDAISALIEPFAR